MRKNNFNYVSPNTILKEMKQTGKVKSIKRDISRIAQLPGKKVSRSGLVYWETRKNRSDNYGQNT